MYKGILNRKTTKSTIISLIIVSLIYIFFFTSKFTLPNPITTKSETTKLGEKYSYSDNRSYTLLSCEYSKKNKELELVLDLENNSYDNVNGYYYAATVLGASNKVEIEEVLNEQLLAVYRIKNLKDFDEVTFMLAPKIDDIDSVTDEDTAFITLNKYNVENVDYITSKDKEDYLLIRLEKGIENYEKKIKKLQKEIDELVEQKYSLISDNRELEGNKKYLTEDEITNAQNKQQENKNMIKDIEVNIKNKNYELEELTTKYNEAKLKIENLKK